MTSATFKIGFLLGSPEINGGTYVIYEHASRLLGYGHQVAVITEAAVPPETYAWHPEAAQLEWLTLAAAENREFDLVLATWWQSPLLLHRLSADHFAYFVQSIESRFFAKEDPHQHDTRELSILQGFCESTYSFALPVITEAAWIREYLHDNYNTSAVLVRNGIRKDLYREQGELVEPRLDGGLRVLVEGPVEVVYKNVPRSIELCRQAGVDEIWLLTSSDITEFPGVDRVFSRVPIHETPAIYRSCDVLVKLSYIEGMFGPPLEMFHCGGTAIVYNVTGHDEYIVHDRNSLVVEKDDEDRVVSYLQLLRSDSAVLNRLKQGAAATALSWPGWETSSFEFAQALEDVCKQEKTGRNYLSRKAERIFAAKDAALAVKDLGFFARREKQRGRAEESIDNFVQVYWHQGEGFNQDNFQAFHYTSGTLVKLTFEVEMTGLPFRIRIDPSVRMGIIEIHAMEIVNQRTGRRILACFRPSDFDALSPDGTIRRMEQGAHPVYLSYGSDPQLSLPVIEEGRAGDHLRVKLVLRETGMGQFIDESCRSGGLRTLCRRIISKLLSGLAAWSKQRP